MTATVHTLPTGKRVVRCDHCRTSAVTPFREVAFKWARAHKCGTPDTVQADGSVFEPVPDGVA